MNIKKNEMYDLDGEEAIELLRIHDPEILKEGPDDPEKQSGFFIDVSTKSSLFIYVAMIFKAGERVTTKIRFCRADSDPEFLEAFALGAMASTALIEALLSPEPKGPDFMKN